MHCRGLVALWSNFDLGVGFWYIGWAYATSLISCDMNKIDLMILIYYSSDMCISNND
jgi:hypothetical protein